MVICPHERRSASTDVWSRDNTCSRAFLSRSIVSWAWSMIVVPFASASAIFSLRRALWFLRSRIFASTFAISLSLLSTLSFFFWVRRSICDWASIFCLSTCNTSCFFAGDCSFWSWSFAFSRASFWSRSDASTLLVSSSARISPAFIFEPSDVLIFLIFPEVPK